MILRYVIDSSIRDEVERVGRALEDVKRKSSPKA